MWTIPRWDLCRQCLLGICMRKLLLSCWVKKKWFFWENFNSTRSLLVKFVSHKENLFRLLTLHTSPFKQSIQRQLILLHERILEWNLGEMWRVLGASKYITLPDQKGLVMDFLKHISDRERWADERATPVVQTFPPASPMVLPGRRMEELLLVLQLLQGKGDWWPNFISVVETTW